MNDMCVGMCVAIYYLALIYWLIYLTFAKSSSFPNPYLYPQAICAWEQYTTLWTGCALHS